MSKIGRFLNKIKTGKLFRNKKISKFFPVFLVSLITLTAFILLLKDNGFNKIFNKLFKDPTFTEEKTEFQLKHANNIDVLSGNIDPKNSNPANSEYTVSLYTWLDAQSSNFKNKDYIIVFDMSPEKIYSYDGTLVDMLDLIFSGENNRAAFKFTFSNTSDYNNYKSDLNTMTADLYNVQTPETYTRTNGYKEAYEFLQANPPANGRDVSIIYVTDDTMAMEKYVGYYNLIKKNYSDTYISYILECNTEKLIYSEKDYLKIADSAFTEYRDSFPASIRTTGLSPIYTNYTITATLSDYTEVVTAESDKGNVETTTEDGNQVIRVTIPRMDYYYVARNLLVANIKIKPNAPEYVPFFKKIELDYIDENNVHQHVTASYPLIFSENYTVDFNPRTPDGCSAASPDSITNRKGVPFRLPEAPQCEGYRFMGWVVDNSSNSPIRIHNEVYTYYYRHLIYNGRWEKVTLKKEVLAQ